LDKIGGAENCPLRVKEVKEERERVLGSEGDREREKERRGERERWSKRNM
jgi:hypothetical protein